MTRIVLATENAHKLKEFRAIARDEVEIDSLTEIQFATPLPPEGVVSYEENATQKAEFVGERIDRLSLGDDSGFEVEALGDAPGLISARWLGTHHSPDQRREILKRLEGVDSRRAKFVCVLSLYLPQTHETKLFRGEVKGVVAREERGNQGFGYDPIFIPDEFAASLKTFSELTEEEKNQISHRGRAFRSCLEFIKTF